MCARTRTRDGEVFAYQGRTALTVTGPATGMVYRFAAPGARVRVDPRDAAALRRIAVLRAVGSGP
jgi:hypothetical protein